MDAYAHRCIYIRYACICAYAYSMVPTHIYIHICTPPPNALSSGAAKELNAILKYDAMRPEFSGTIGYPEQAG